MPALRLITPVFVNGGGLAPAAPRFRVVPLKSMGPELVRLKEGVRFTQVYYGPAERQIRTGEIVGDLYKQAGRHWPEPRHFHRA